ncbi:MAG: thymidine phosphorylase [Acidobacteria bacterium]|nr:thymidine phosphorylase [Acidobacteriota bacterium]MCA1608820.1 thymidine phosphorylase [Acidobacteriota bacterium]
MRPQEIITIKRDGHTLSEKNINAFVDGVCDGSWADYQISAFLMAMFTRGLDDGEQEALTRAMLNSGDVLKLSEIAKPKADKHSTGGVGDKTSLIIAPIVASCGVAVPMISGRGLGHTGGTLDKLESIPGFNVNLTVDEIRRVVDKCGYAMAGQTAEIVPADKKLYALRDATATVPYIPLIVASIMSKKLAEGLDALVLDVKTGSGAFMKNLEDARTLAEQLVSTGEKFGVKTKAVISDMNQPLGRAVGNALEVFECIEILSGDVDNEAASTWELSIDLCARVLRIAGMVATHEEGIALASSKVWSGEAFDTFRRNVDLQGGDTSVCDNPRKLFDSTLLDVPIVAKNSGYIVSVDTAEIGRAVAAIGGGRLQAEDEIDCQVGFECKVRIGKDVSRGDTLGVVYCRDEAQAQSIEGMIRQAYEIDREHRQAPPKLIIESVG